MWHKKDVDQNAIGEDNYTWQKLEVRLNEMLERRRRLIKYMFKKEGKVEEFEEKYLANIKKKD